MDPERWRRVREVFDRAAELEPGERSAFLEVSCRGDPGLRREVESLLARAEEPGDSIGEAVRAEARGVDFETPTAPSQAQASGSIGPYRILKTLGEGGMGTVFLAEQREPIRRRVALKVIRRGAVAPHQVRRFEAERQALARMSHPNIAQVFEAGTTQDGEPYLVMEHVAGLPITEYCDRERLGVGRRLELFLAVCEGVQHAHQKGIIHRDLKPSNVLVTEISERGERSRPVPKVIDFGVAKALDQPLTDGTVFTGDRLIGTPAYWSPEAIRASGGGLDVDTRSDVYALGVMLYELLSGELPYTVEGRGLVEVLRAITDEPAPSPSRRLGALDEERRETTAERRRTGVRALAARLRGDLDWICLKAMAKERSRRYGSVAGLAVDVERHLAHQPVVAGPPGPVYRMRKFVRRHRAGVAAVVLVALALVGGLFVRTLEAERANREAERANREAEAARQISDFLVDLFEVSDPGEARGNTITAREILDRGAERIRGELSDQPLTRARLLDTIGAVYRQLGLYEPAAPLLEEALELRRGQLGDDHPDTASSLQKLGHLYEQEGRYSEAESLFRTALPILEAALGPEHPEFTYALGRLASIAWVDGRNDEAQALFERALAIEERERGSAHAEVGMLLLGLGNVHMQQAAYMDSERLYRRALANLERSLGPDHPEVAKIFNNIAAIYYRQHRYEKALPLFERALAIKEKVFGRDHPDVGTAVGNVAFLYTMLERYPEAESLTRRSLEVLEKVLGPDHPSLAIQLENLAELRRRQRRFQDAERLLLKALALTEQAFGPEHYRAAGALAALADVCREQSRLDEAEAYLERALAIQEKLLPPKHPELASTVERYALLLRLTGREGEARSLESRFPDLGIPAVE